MRAHLDEEFQRRLGPTVIDHVKGDAGLPEEKRRELDDAGVGIEGFDPVGCRVAVGLDVQTHEFETVAFDVVDLRHQLIDREDGRFFEFGRFRAFANARRVVHGGEVDLDIRRVLRPVIVLEHIAEPGKSEVVGPRQKLDVLTRDLPRRVSGISIVVFVPVGPECFTIDIGQRLCRNDAQAFHLCIAVDVVVVGQQVFEPDAQRRVLDAVDKRIVVGDRRVIDG